MYLLPLSFIDEYPRTFLVTLVLGVSALIFGFWYDAKYDKPERDREVGRWVAFRADCILEHPERRCWELWEYRFKHLPR